MVISIMDQNKHESSTKIDSLSRQRRSRNSRHSSRLMREGCVNKFKLICLKRSQRKSMIKKIPTNHCSDCESPSCDTTEFGPTYTRSIWNNQLIETKDRPNPFLRLSPSTDIANIEYFKLINSSQNEAVISSNNTTLGQEEQFHYKESLESRKQKWWRTIKTLRESGLLNVTMKTAELLRKNQQLQQEIENLQKETKNFVVSVLSNPENGPVLADIRSHSQLYELIVPGSQKIMSVQTSFDASSSMDDSFDSSTNVDLENTARSPWSLYSDPSSPMSSPNTGSYCSSTDEDDSSTANSH